MASVLVTGGAGFIGSHLCERLLSEDNGVVCLDNFNDFYPEAIKRQNIVDCLKDKNFSLEEIDLLDADGLDRLFSKKNIEKIIHLAAYAGVHPSIKNPRLYCEANVTGTVNLLEVARKNEIKNFVFGSSSSIYGINSKMPFNEEDFVGTPISPYAASKRSGELLCHVYGHLYGLNIACLRLFTVYGPRQRPDLAIHKFTKLIDSGASINMYGDGSSARDYTYVADILNGIMAAFEKEFRFEIINLGNEHPIKLKRMIEVIEESLQKKAKINQMPDQPGDVPITYADIGKAKKMLNYQPTVSIEDGIKRFVEWYKESDK
ncbi:MAG: GDP-mannose 4,6-dehydratase [Candidatus Altiarchaeota archaeon]